MKVASLEGVELLRVLAALEFLIFLRLSTRETGPPPLNRGGAFIDSPLAGGKYCCESQPKVLLATNGRVHVYVERHFLPFPPL